MNKTERAQRRLYPAELVLPFSIYQYNYFSEANARVVILMLAYAVRQGRIFEFVFRLQQFLCGKSPCCCACAANETKSRRTYRVCLARGIWWHDTIHTHARHRRQDVRGILLRLQCASLKSWIPTSRSYRGRCRKNIMTENCMWMLRSKVTHPGDLRAFQHPRTVRLLGCRVVDVQLPRNASGDLRW